ncbi:MAG TPA: PAS domain-containing protein, partial [Dongiaceae bacterium]
MAMLLAHGQRSREPVTEERLQFGKKGRMGVVTGQRRCSFHGSIPRATNFSSAPAAAIGSRSRYGPKGRLCRDQQQYQTMRPGRPRKRKAALHYSEQGPPNLRFLIALRSETVEALKPLRLRATQYSSARQRPMMGSGRPQGSIQKVITTLEFLSVCSGPVRDIYAYWDRRREGRRMPSLTDIKAAEFAGHLPGIVFVEVQRDPLNYVYRSVGAREIEARGSDPTGKSVADYWHGGGGMEAVLGNYNYVT